MGRFLCLMALCAAFAWNGADAAGCTSQLMALSTASENGADQCTPFEALQSCSQGLKKGAHKVAIENAVVAFGASLTAVCTDKTEPAISTNAGKLVYAGEDHTFVRRRRDAVSLFDMSDAVDDHKQKLAKLASDRSTDLAAQSKINGKIAEDVKTLASSATKMTGQLEAIIAAASSGEDAACTPGVEYQSGTDKTTKKAICKYLTQPCNTFVNNPMYEKTAATRTSDRVCVPVTLLGAGQYMAALGGAFKDNVYKKLTVCTKTQYQTLAPTRTSDRQCKTITDCLKLKKVVLKPATATTDAVCASLGMVSSSPARDCVEIKQKFSTMKSGWFYVKSKVGVRKVWCDQTHAGGGWMLVGHMQGREKTCWGNTGDCNTNRGQNAQEFQKKTWRHGDSFVNSFTYYAIRLQGTNSKKGDNYFMGKNNNPSCHYNHNNMATGTCKRSYKTISSKLGGAPNFGGGCQGRNHGCHRGVGDWPCYGGEVTSNHCNGGSGSGRGWYYHSASTGGSQGSGQCWTTMAGCDVDMWIR